MRLHVADIRARRIDFKQCLAQFSLNHWHVSPVTHFLAGWLVANAAALNRRERACVRLAGVAADVDGLGLIAETLMRGSAQPLLWWTNYHHVFGHNLFFGLAVTAAGWCLATRRWLTAALALLSFHVHLVGDLVGARGPDGYVWTIPYLWPVSSAGVWSWQGQWKLNGWPNFVITIALLAATFYLAWRRGRSPLELVTRRADKIFVEALRRRFSRS